MKYQSVAEPACVFIFRFEVRYAKTDICLGNRFVDQNKNNNKDFYVYSEMWDV